MYVTRPVSMYRKSPSTLSAPTPDIPYSGFLVITDEEAEADDSYCWGLCKRDKVKQLPFPQDCVLKITHFSEHQHQTSSTKVLFIPVPDHPLSSNRYYVIRADGRHKGYLIYCSCYSITFSILHFVSCVMLLVVTEINGLYVYIFIKLRVSVFCGVKI